jgi:3-ketosteroid 9alpha-monooxygenase subunit A
MTSGPTSPRGFPPIPHGWYAVAESRGLAKGDVRTLHLFGGDRVLFRTESGRAALVDAHCAHLGAHMGHGGKVKGETLACPFHDWRYDSTGRCVAIEYARRVPRLAQVGAWQVREQDGIVFASYPSGVSSTAIPRWEGLDDADFEIIGGRTFTLRSHPQDIAENTVDTAHFPVLHDSATPELELRIDGPVLHAGFDAKLQFRKKNVPGFPLTRIDITVYGLTHLVVHTRLPGLTELAVLQYVVPTGEDELLVRHRYAAKVGRGLKKIPRLGLAWLAAAFSLGEAARDRPVWNHKIYRERPVLCDGDGPIGQFRTWATQFYGAAPMGVPATAPDA